MPDEPVPQSRRDARRAVNVAVALLAVVVTLPLMLVIALAIRLTSRGPVLDRQIRVGIDRRTAGQGHWRRSIDYGGRLFTMYSFRTMPARPARAGAGDAPAARPTPVGALLRRGGLDALPQLFNVLRGEMNVVGPRPARPNTFVELRHRVHSYSERQKVLPGIIGFGEVDALTERESRAVERLLERELRYARAQSVRRDVRIMTRAVARLFRRRRGRGGASRR